MATMAAKVVQIIGPCWPNKGDQLMVLALQQRLTAKYYLPLPISLRVPPSRFWTPSNIGIVAGQMVYWNFQILTHGKPDAILDCSGYQYGDPWEDIARFLEARRLWYQWYRKRGRKIVILPQAFGPFEKDSVASLASEILQLADLIFARDELSRRHVLSLGYPVQRVRVAPDFTNLLSPEMPDNPDQWSQRVCLVPNIRMIDKKPPGIAVAYMGFLRRCAQKVLDLGLEPCILLHHPEDRALATDLQKSLQRHIRLADPPPLKAKGILGSCRAVISSRYHALVSALSQATPALGTSWSHKYRALFRDYSCEECLIERLDSDSEIEEKISLITDEESMRRLVERLRKGSQQHMNRTLEMWTELERFLNGDGAPSPPS